MARVLTKLNTGQPSPMKTPINKLFDKKSGPGIKSNNPMKQMVIANHRMSLIVIPRSLKGQNGALHRVAFTPLIFAPGTTTMVDAEIWTKVKQTNLMVQKYLDHQLLTEVDSESEMVSVIAQTSDPVPPEHLQTVDELRGKVRLERQDVSEMLV